MRRLSIAIYIILLLGLTAQVIYASFLAIRELFYVENRLRKAGKLTQATIIERYIEKNRGGKGVSYHISYEFHYNDIRYEQKGVWVSRSHYQQLATIPNVIVTYLEENPSISRLAGKDKDKTYRNGLVLGAIIFSLGATSLWQNLLKSM